MGSSRLVWSVLTLTVALLAAAPARAVCSAEGCDRAAVDAVRAEAAEACGCVTTTDRTAYQRCAMGVVERAARDGRLSTWCASRTLQCEVRGRCGTAASGFASSSGVRIHHVSLGKGPLVVMIHGFPDFWLTWRRQMAALSDDHQVVAIDTRGYNLSDRPAGVDAYAMERLLDDVEAVIRDFGRDRAIVVGHDWGAFIAWNLALQRPGLVERLVILSVPHPRGFRRELATNPAQAAASAYTRGLVTPGAAALLGPGLLAAIAGETAQRDRYLEAFARSDPEAMTSYYKANFPAFPYTEDTSPVVKIGVPVLVLAGREDPFLLPAGFDRTWEWIDAPLTLEILPGVGHWVQRDAAARVTSTLVDWLRR